MTVVEPEKDDDSDEDESDDDEDDSDDDKVIWRFLCVLIWFSYSE